VSNRRAPAGTALRGVRCHLGNGGPKVDDVTIERDRDTGRDVDTNLISETRKGRADAGVMAFLAAADSAGLFLSDLTLGELRKGVEAKRRTDSAMAAPLGAWVDGIESTFADRVLPVDAAAARLWGELSAGRSLPVIDTLIAATAITRDLTLVTRNTRDVASTGVPLVDPWQGG
jgi:predicted nucleic acid-binding protein